jgi:hypothetical protein
VQHFGTVQVANVGDIFKPIALGGAPNRFNFIIRVESLTNRLKSYCVHGGMWMDGLGRKVDTAKSLICLFVPVNRLSKFVVSSFIIVVSKFNVSVRVLLGKMTMIRPAKIYLFTKSEKCITLFTETWV